MRSHHPTFRHWPKLARHYRRIVGLEREIIDAQQRQPRVDTRLPLGAWIVLAVFIAFVLLLAWPMIVGS